MVLSVLEQRAPPRTLERMSVGSIDTILMTSTARWGRVLAKGHRATVHHRPCGSSVPTSCDFAGDNPSLPVR
jgi:hypothetical protein